MSSDIMSGIRFKILLPKKRNEAYVRKYWEVESENRYMGLLWLFYFGTHSKLS